MRTNNYSNKERFDKVTTEINGAVFLPHSIDGESFVVKCGVCQGAVLSPYLFALYVDELISQPRHSSYVNIGQVFVRSALYGDIIALLSASCYGLQRLNICEQYGTERDVGYHLIILKAN